MRLEYIRRVTEDDVLGKHVYGEDGRILLKAGGRLCGSYIRRLMELGVYYVYVEDERLDEIEGESEELTLLKQATMKSLRGIARNAGDIGCVGEDYIKTIDELLEQLMEIGDVNKCLCDVKTHDNYTFLHSINTGTMSVFFGMSLGLKKWVIRELGMSGMLHDVGKLRVPTSIINKDGKLTNEEFEVMKKHPIYGSEILRKSMRIPARAIEGVEQHHEKINGKGYPYGLQGNQICKFAKIVGICDVYDAVTSNRSYRRKFEPNQAYELILSGAGTQFDTTLVNTFKNTFSVYALGSCVRLSNGVEGYVIKQNKGFPDRPMIRVLYDSVTRNQIPFYEIDLLKRLNLTVECVI